MTCLGIQKYCPNIHAAYLLPNLTQVKMSSLGGKKIFLDTLQISKAYVTVEEVQRMGIFCYIFF